MIGSLLLAALVAQPAPDPCGPVAPLPPDSAAAAAYRAVGDEERAAGRPDSAVAAYRAALARDPAAGEAEEALAALCADRRRVQALERGLAAVRAGRCASALPDLETARELGDPAAALLVGVCLYRAGDDERAGAALRAAERDEATRAAARLFLGLLALRQGRSGEAGSLLAAAAGDPLMGPVAQSLSRNLQRQGRLVLSLAVEAGWDSNVDLTPGTSAAPSGASDAFAGGSSAVTVAPWEDRGPYARADAAWRGYARHGSLDLAGYGAAAGQQWGGARRHLAAEYDLDGRTLGGRPYLTAHRLLGEARWDLGPTWDAGAEYALRHEAFRADTAGYSGWRHSGQLDVSAVLGDRSHLTAAYRAERDLARDPALGYREHGPALRASAALGSRSRLEVEAAWTWRRYDVADPGLGVVRADGYADLAARLEVELGAAWALDLAVAGRRAYSSLADFRYARLVPSLGLSWTRGIP